jgi:hypothetical protein
MIQDIFDKILPSKTKEEKLVILKNACTPDIFEGLYCFDGTNLNLLTDKGKYTLYYGAFLEVYKRSSKNLGRSYNQVLAQALNNKRHLKFGLWYRWTLKNPYGIEKLRKYKGLAAPYTWFDYIKYDEDKINLVKLDGLCLKPSEVKPFINFYDTYRISIL